MAQHRYSITHEPHALKHVRSDTHTPIPHHHNVHTDPHIYTHNLS